MTFYKWSFRKKFFYTIRLQADIIKFKSNIFNHWLKKNPYKKYNFV